MTSDSTERANPSATLSVAVPPALVEQIALRAAAIIGERESPDPLLSVDEAAEYLRCKRKRIYDLCSMGCLPYEKDGRRTLIRRSAIDGHLAAGDP